MYLQKTVQSVMGRKGNTYLILIKYLAMMEVSMREYPIDATTHRAQLGH